MKQILLTWLRAADAWLFQPRHRDAAQRVRAQAYAAFTTHPHEAGETYLQHLWFTLRMAARFMVACAVLLIHGLIPCLFTHAASAQIEAMYRIMKTRIPKARRDEIDGDYSV